MTGVESTQHVESLNRVLKKHMDREILLKELVKVIESELDKEAQYSWIKDYYGSNLSTGLLSTYNTIFKDIDFILKDFLASILLSLQRTQVNESDNKPNSIIKHIYDRSQIRL